MRLGDPLGEPFVHDKSACAVVATDIRKAEELKETLRGSIFAKLSMEDGESEVTFGKL